MSTIIDNEIDAESDEAVLYRRLGKKKRMHLTLSPEVIYVLQETQGAGDVSQFVERAVWDRLVEECDVDRLRGLIEERQRRLESDERLEFAKPYPPRP